MATAKFDIKNIPSGATRPFYAYVGATDLAVETVRDYVADVSKKVAEVQADVQKRAADFDFEPKALREKAEQVLTARVEAFGKDAKARREAAEKRVAELQADAKELPAKVTETYADLAKRGENLVDRIRRQQSTQETVAAAKTTVAKAKTTRTQATKATTSTAKKATSSAKSTTGTAKKAAAPATSSAKATGTSARKTATRAARAAAEAVEKVGD